jgi:hypothetical protein
MDRFTADFRQLSQLDVGILRLRPVAAGPRRTFPPVERSAVKASLGLGKSIDKKLALLAETVGIGDRPPTVTVLRPSTTMASLALSKSSALTVALGFGGSAFVFFGALGSVGVYGSTTREIGTYETIGMGLFFPAVGASVGGELTFVLGTPADLAGPYYSAGVTVAPAVLGVGGQLLFSPGPPLTFMGISISLSANTPSELPVTVTLEVTNTWTQPRLKF